MLAVALEGLVQSESCDLLSSLEGAHPLRAQCATLRQLRLPQRTGGWIFVVPDRLLRGGLLPKGAGGSMVVRVVFSRGRVSLAALSRGQLVDGRETNGGQDEKNDLAAGHGEEQRSKLIPSAAGRR